MGSQETLVAKTRITVHATPEQVWETMTKPERVKKYMMGADVASDWRVGGPLVYTGTFQGKKFEEKGVIKKIEPCKTLQATHFSATSGQEDRPENYHLVTWQLEPAGDETIVTVTQDGISGPKGLETSEKNWKTILEGLKKTAEGTVQH